jgi:hypothetical protein
VSLLGLAEVLGAPQVVLAGADHAWYTAENSPFKYHDAMGGAGVPEPFQGTPLICSAPDTSHSTQPFGSFSLPDRNGFQATTYFHYLAIAVELERVAEAIAATTGTRFYLLHESGILSKSAFHEGGQGILAGLPPLDRDTIACQLAMASGRPEKIDTAALLRNVGATRDSVRQQAAYLDILLAQGDLEKAASHPFVEALRQSGREQKFPALADTEDAVRTTVGACREWIRAMETAIALLHLVNTRGLLGQEVLLLCEPGEDFLALEQEFRRRYPNPYIEVRNFILPGINDAAVRGLSNSRISPFETLVEEASRRRIIGITPRVLDKHGVLFRQLDQSRLLLLEHLFAVLPAWPLTPLTAVAQAHGLKPA